MLFMIQSDRKGLEVTPPSLWILINQGRTFKSLFLKTKYNWDL